MYLLVINDEINDNIKGENQIMITILTLWIKTKAQGIPVVSSINW